jgi:hypothetical protein
VKPHADAMDLWPGRLALIARHIPAGSRVLDLGAGAQSLKGHLKHCAYTPADVTRRTPDTLDFDMEADIYPFDPDGEWDVAVMAGVLEYATDPSNVLDAITFLTPVLLLSYAHGGSLDYRRRQQWRNHLSRAGLEQALGETGWKARTLKMWRGQVIYRATR